jgi:hypothetical protein
MKRIMLRVLSAAVGMALASAAYAQERPVKVTFTVKPYSQMRYETVGDWQFSKNGDLKITIARMSRPEYEEAIGVHEFVEALACKAAGVSEKDVDKFDKAYKGPFEEPGDDPKAPYHPMHVAATKIERMFIASQGLDWDTYNAEVESMGK